jgi:hypothetical protein
MYGIIYLILESYKYVMNFYGNSVIIKPHIVTINKNMSG